MKRVLFLLSVLLLSISGVLAKDIAAEKVSISQARKIGFMSEANARKEFAGYTFTLSKPKVKANALRTAFPFSGTVVAYFAPNGRILIWSKKSEKVVAGAWGVGAPLDKGSKAGNLVCFDFSPRKEKYHLCPIIKVYGKNIYQRAKGNIFNLRAGGKVPKVLKSIDHSLQKIHDGLGK